MSNTSGQLPPAGGNANQQFVGAYAVNIEPGEVVGMARFTVYNVTSLNSFLYHADGVPALARNRHGAVTLGVNYDLGLSFTRIK